MRIHFIAPNRIEPWDYRALDVGIGGSETSQIEMALRMAARGHDVTSYTDLPGGEGFDPNFGGVRWRDLADADLSEPGLWIVYRQPSLGLRCAPAPGRRYWLVCQDVFYPDWSPEAVAAFDRVIGLCPRHLADIRGRDPSVGDRLCMSSNGVNVDDIEAAEGRLAFSGIERNPRRLIWTSSPDRGLRELLAIFERARERVPDLVLEIFYGMDNIEKICGGDRARAPWRDTWRVYDRALAMAGVTWHGRVGQGELHLAQLESGLWCYPTWFSETSCISAMEAQATGCIPITNPIWATAHNVRDGVFVEGTPAEPMIMARYVEAVVALALDPAFQDHVRASMMPRARAAFDWSVWVDQWAGWMACDAALAEAA